MIRLPRWLQFSFAILILLVCSSGRPYQQRTPDGGLYFPETQKSIKGEFLQFFQQTPNNLVVLGFPVSDQMTNPVNSQIVHQYFQRARLDLDTSGPVGKRITLAPLGEWMQKNESSNQAALIDINALNCRYFSSTQHYVCYAFLQYYDAYHGETYFGQPISEVEMDGNVMVQYFEYARLEWRAERPVGRRVTQTDLGTLANPGQTMVRSEANIIGGKQQLNVRVFCAKPLLGMNEAQTIFVVVQDQNYAPVARAAVKVTVQDADGSTAPYRPVETNAQGFTQLDNLTVSGFNPNDMVLIQVEVIAPGEISGGAKTWFRVWW